MAYYFEYINKISFYKWSTGAFGRYTINKNEFGFVNNLMAFTAIEVDKVVGFFTMRRPSENFDNLRFCVIEPAKAWQRIWNVLMVNKKKNSHWCSVTATTEINCFINNF